jgi:hypothetical protein
MSQPSVQWTSSAADPLLPSNLFPPIKQELYDDAQPDEPFRQDESDELIFPSANDGFEHFSFPSEDASFSEVDCTGLPSESTPDFSTYSFTPESSAYTGTPHPPPVEHQQTYQHIPFHHRPLPSRAHTNTTFTQPPQGYDRRRSLSHGDVDRIAALPHHPTFVRLQGSQSSWSTTPEDNTGGPGTFSRHVRSVSQGPTYLGRPLKHAVPYTYSRSLLVGGTPIGTPIGSPMRPPMAPHLPRDERGSRKRMRHPRYDYDDDDEPLIHHVTDPLYLAHSRRIIEIGAMAVRNHTPNLDANVNDNLSSHERILKKLSDVETYLQQHEADNEDALKGCEMIREALGRRNEVEYQDAATEGDESELPSKMMSTDDIGLFGGCFGEEDIMGLLAT